jgi:hypothetical protein
MWRIASVGRFEFTHVPELELLLVPDRAAELVNGHERSHRTSLGVLSAVPRTQVYHCAWRRVF